MQSSKWVANRAAITDLDGLVGHQACGPFIMQSSKWAANRAAITDLDGLVGHQTCGPFIMQSCFSRSSRPVRHGALPKLLRHARHRRPPLGLPLAARAVSYTHLTLPTICSV
eukprot:114097-Prymnesium_polylepis.1